MNYTISAPDGSPIPVTLKRDKRLKKTLRWQREADGTILLRVPARYPQREIPGILKQLEHKVAREKKRARGRTDGDLQTRATELNRLHFGGELQWEAIRWVGNMNTRLGSCTTAGASQGHIRISDKIKGWPGWVVDYVICHELAHLKHPNHSKSFWAYLKKAYPRTDEARGFVKGVGYAEGTDLGEED